MRHIDIDFDQPQGYRAWPRAAGRGSGGKGQTLLALTPLAHPLRGGLMIAGRLLDAGAVMLAAMLVTAGPGVEMIAAAVLAVQILDMAGGYRDEAGYGKRLLPALLAPAVAVAAVAAFGGSPHWAGAGAWAGLSAALSMAGRLFWGRVLARSARSSAAARRVLVVGDRGRALEVLSLLAGNGRRWAFPVGVLVDRDPPAGPVLGGFITSIDEAERVIHDEHVDDVIVAVPWAETARLADCLERLRPLAVDVHLFPDDPGPFVEGAGVSVVAGVPMARLGGRPLAGARAAVKAAEDRALGVLALLLAAPLMALIAVAIRLDSPGPVLFRQSRTGYDNRPFTCFKFRSMRVGSDGPQVRQATRDDPRVTRIGRLLRRTSLDELPQLFNVLNGSMSLVGPRPHALSHHHLYARLVDDYRCRHRMKPGITGWAQVNGYRGETATVELMRKRVLHDLWYIDNWSLWLDLKILARTPLACIKGTNAY